MFRIETEQLRQFNGNFGQLCVTDWQKHSIRGFLSAQLTKKMKLKVESTKSEAGERTYRIVS